MFFPFLLLKSAYSDDNKIGITPDSLVFNYESMFPNLRDYVKFEFPPSLTDQSIKCSSANEDIIFFPPGSCRFRLEGIGTTTATVISLVDENINGSLQITIKDPTIQETYVDVDPSDMSTHRDRMYIKIKFEIQSSSEDISVENSVGIHGIEVQPSGSQGFELLNKDISSRGYATYGYCVKYGCASKVNLDPTNQRIGKSNQGIDYYVGNNQLYTAVKTSGTTSYGIYTVPYLAAARHYVRENLIYSIPWNEYDPTKHANAAKFTLNIVNRVSSVTFDGFDNISILPSTPDPGEPEPEPKPDPDPSDSSSISASSEGEPVKPEQTDPHEPIEPNPDTSTENGDSGEGESSKEGNPSPGLGLGPIIGIIAAAVVVVGAIVIIAIVVIKKQNPSKVRGKH